MKRDELKEHFTLQMRLRELCDEAGVERPLSKRELQIGLLALQAEPPRSDQDINVLDLSRTI
ncbi:MAG: hypothetical protein CL573_03225 [Alphaproteobacteria bacterium]|nr:hypothetical protein [Alphaproteobacteria bacterium]HCP01577.1 hypothetical protein [Rhodospirillaceae bacterium]